MDETLELVKRCGNMAFHKMPHDVIDTAKYLLLDYLGVTIRGSQTESAKCAQSLARKFHSTVADMAIIGTDITTDSLNAALANGIAAHSIECDDVVNEASLHPAVTVMTIKHAKEIIQIVEGFENLKDVRHVMKELTPL